MSLDQQVRVDFEFMNNVFWNLQKDYDYFLQNPNIAP